MRSFSVLNSWCTTNVTGLLMQMRLMLHGERPARTDDRFPKGILGSLQWESRPKRCCFDSTTSTSGTGTLPGCGPRRGLRVPDVQVRQGPPLRTGFHLLFEDPDASLVAEKRRRSGHWDATFQLCQSISRTLVRIYRDVKCFITKIQKYHSSKLTNGRHEKFKFGLFIRT